MTAGLLEKLLEANESLVREVSSLQGKVARIEEDKRLPQEWYMSIGRCVRAWTG